MDPVTISYLGLDVSKAKVDCALLLNNKVKSKVVQNTPEGFNALTQWLIKYGADRVHACCEATGTYSDAIALFLHEQGHIVSVANPAQIAAYAQSQLSRAKTDALDARLILRYCERERPEPWVPPPAEERLLLALLRDLQDLQTMRQAEANRLDSAHPSVRERIERHLQFLAHEIEQLRKKIEQHIDHHDQLRGRRDLLDSVPGLGEHTIPWLIAYLGDGQRFDSAKRAVAFFGLCPKPRQSGSSVRGKTRIAKTGHADLRHALYMPALVAYSRCAAFAPFVQRLKAAGKPPKVIIVALMRKLVAIAQAILKSGKPFDPTLHHA
ncbi:MAG: IS110 family transposase [Burkholderiales bacterium]|nr:IS110 family transposase [Burkholderiales bacterium]